MSDLLAIGRSGVLAYRDALATTGENVVNADTEGFAKRKVTLTEQYAPGDAYSLNRTRASLGGVQASQVQRVWDQYQAQNAWSAGSDAGQADARSTWLSTIETNLPDGDTGVGSKLTAVFTSANALAATPADTTLRQTMLSAIDDAAATLRLTAGNLAKVAGSASQQAGQTVQSVNDAVAALARVNVSLRATAAGTGARAQLEDQRDALIGTISGSLAVEVTFASSGAATLSVGGDGGAPLLGANGDDARQLSLVTAADGRLSLTLTDATGATTAASASSGTLAGMIGAAATLADRRAQLDALAADFAGKLNRWQGDGLDQTGAAGVPLLGNGGPDPTVAITAGNIAPATSDTGAIAAATADGGNANLLALAKLRGSDGVEARWRGMVTDQALRVASAKSQATAAASAREGALTALDSVSGVSLDAEAADLLRFQQAYSASSKIIQTARDTFQAVLDLF